jgi:hypothetical protein
MSINPLLRPSTTEKDLPDGKPGVVTLRSYQHASRIFTDADFRLSPKYNFLFYVEFDFNPLITSISNLTAQEMGMIVKNVALPKFSIQVKEHNAYNRKNYVQNAIKYDPVTITFHDDQADNVRNFWYDYYSYYYRDPDYADATYQAAHKYQSRPAFDWGYSPRAAVGYNSSRAAQPYQYIQAIRIYSLYQKNFSEYQLINPIITSFKHGEHVNGEAGTMQHEMSVQFETVKYYTGYTTANTVGGYIDLHYDNTPSPISPVAGTDIVDNGTGGITKVTDKVYDLATPSTTQYSQSMGFQSTATNPANIISNALNKTTNGSASGSNAGGYTLSVFGSTGGLAGSVTGTASKSLVNAAGSLTNGVTGAATGSFASGTIGALGAAIANPKAAINTVMNMALAFGEGVAMNYITNSVVNPAVQAGTNAVDGFVKTNIEQPLSNLSKDISNWWNSNTPIDTKAIGGVFDNPTGSVDKIINGASVQNISINVVPDTLVVPTNETPTFMSGSDTQIT